MTQEDHKLILKDLCARVPYHPKGHVVNACNGAQCDEWLTCATFSIFANVRNNCRLYLRPLSSMTEEEKEEFDFLGWRVDELEDNEPWVFNHGIRSIEKGLDWLLKNHFDFRGLIEKGLAIEVTEDNNPYKDYDAKR